MENLNTDALIALNEDRKNSKDSTCDVIIQADQTQFRCHRRVLSDASDYFRTLFLSDFAERNDKVLKLSGPIGGEISEQSLAAVFEFMYTRQAVLAAENVIEILLAAEFLQVAKLKVECMEYLLSDDRDSITAENWLETYRVASLLGGQQRLVTRCVKTLAAVSKDNLIVEYEEFFDILHAHHAKVANCDLFSAVVNWCENNLDDDNNNDDKSNNENERFEELVSFVNFDSISESFFDENVLCSRYVRAINKDSDLLAAIKNSYQRSKSRGILVLGGYINTTFVKRYTPERKQFTSCPNPFDRIKQSAVAASGNFVYVAGGFGNRASVQVYDYKENTWTLRESCLPAPRQWSSAVVADGRLYVSGGYDDDTMVIVPTTLVFDINGTQCCRAASTAGHPELTMKQARMDHGLLVRDRVIYAVGGYCDDHVSLDSCESLDVATGQQCDIAPLNVSRNDVTAVMYQDSIIVLGGYHNENNGEIDVLDSIEQYCFDADQWSVLPPMAEPRFRHCACVFEDRIFVIGGKDSDTVDVYDPDSSKWELYDTLKEPLVWPRSCVISMP